MAKKGGEHSCGFKEFIKENHSKICFLIQHISREISKPEFPLILPLKPYVFSKGLHVSVNCTAVITVQVVLHTVLVPS